MINRTPLFEGLRQLANEDQQRALWIYGDEKRMSSFTEAMCYVFDASGLSKALDSGYAKTHLSPPLYEKIRQLRKLIHEVPENTPPIEIVEHPKFKMIRQIAGELIELFSAEIGP
jgi:hypothetical protein